MQRSTLAKRAALLFFIAAAIFYLYGLGRLPLLGPDEPRYAQVAREMYLRGDMVTPTLGGHTWFEKPALLYWMIMGGYGLFGFTEWAARFGPAVCGLLSILFVYWTGKRVERASGTQGDEGGLGLWSAVAFASSLGSIVFSRAASFDVVVTMTVTFSLFCFFSAETEPEGKRRGWYMAGFYAGVGASLLAKGLVGVILPFSVVGLYYLLRRKWPVRSMWVSLLWGIPLALAVASLWYGPVIAKNGWAFVDEFFVQHHFARYFSNKYKHPQPFYFYLPIMLMLALPWTGFLIKGLGSSRRRKWREETVESKYRVFALAWLVAPLAFFTFSGSKLPAYVLPALPGAALLVGHRLKGFVRGEGVNWDARATGLILLSLATALIVYSLRGGDVSAACAIAVAAPLALAAIPILVGFGGRALRVELICCAIFISVTVALNCAVGALGHRESVRDLIHTADARGYSSAPVFYMLSDDRTGEFYAGGRLVYDAKGEPFRFDGAFELEDAARAAGGTALVLIETRWEKQLTDYRAIKSELIASNGLQSLFLIRVQ